MEFEWDETKDRLNLQKHGISLGEAVNIWSDIHIDVENIAKSKDGEVRHATLGILNNEVMVAIWTKRSDKIRLISVRRARYAEEKTFETYIRNK